MPRTNSAEREGWRAELDAYEDRARRGPCFVCAFVSGHPGYGHHTVFEDADHIAFLDRWPMPVVREIALAVEDCVGAERTYLYSLGSRQGNAHLHWHIAGLPPGVPYERQQFHALMAENGVSVHASRLGAGSGRPGVRMPGDVATVALAGVQARWPDRRRIRRRLGPSGLRQSLPVELSADGHVEFPHGAAERGCQIDFVAVRENHHRPQAVDEFMPQRRPAAPVFDARLPRTLRRPRHRGGPRCSPPTPRPAAPGPGRRRPRSWYSSPPSA